MTGAHPKESRLLDFAGGRLKASARDQVKIHVESCVRCREALASFTETTSTSGEKLDLGAGAAVTRDGDPLIGQVLGEYQVLERLGQGGMGILYRGVQPVIGKMVAIKVLLQAAANDPIFEQRLLEEARAVNAVRHPNIVDIFSFGQLPDGRHYMVMELLEGRSLQAVLTAHQRLSAAQTMVVLAQSMAALEAAHAVGVIHRDLKPDNIFVNERPDGWLVTLLDFGLVKRAGTDGLTNPGTVMGTPGYMAPEQIRGKSVVSAKADIYSMGVVAWTLLAGHEPFGAGSFIEIMARHLTLPAPSLAAAAKDVPPGLEALVMQMLHKEPDRRPTATEVRKAIGQLTKKQLNATTEPELAPVVASAALTTTQTAKPNSWQGSRWVFLALLVGAAALGGWLWLAPPEPLPDVAARPIVRDPRLVDPPPPKPIAAIEPVPIPLPAEEPLPSTMKTWRCSAVARVSELGSTWGGSYFVFEVRFKKDPTSLVVSLHARTGDAEVRETIERVRKAIVACRSSGKLIIASQTSVQPMAFTNVGDFEGTRVDASELSVGTSADADRPHP